MNTIENKRRKLLHYNMAFLGGLSGSYAILVRGGVFGAAQTMNLIELVLNGLDGNWAHLAMRILIMISYGLSIIGAYLLALYFPDRKYRICLSLEGLCVLGAGLIPASVEPLLALCPVFVMSALQWQTFTDADCYNSATIFSTNNMKQTLLSWTNYALKKDPEQKKKAVFFTCTLAAFHAGVLLGYFAVHTWGARSIWLGFLPLAGAVFLTCISPRQKLKPAAAHL